MTRIRRARARQGRLKALVVGHNYVHRSSNEDQKKEAEGANEKWADGGGFFSLLRQAPYNALNYDSPAMFGTPLR